MILDKFLNYEIDTAISSSNTILWNGQLEGFENNYFKEVTE